TSERCSHWRSFSCSNSYPVREVTLMENTNTGCARVTHVKLMLGLIAAVVVSVLLWFRWSMSPISGTEKRVAQRGGSGDNAAPLSGGGHPADMPPPYQPIPVPINRSGEVSPAFRGEVHPVLHGKTTLELAAHWTEVGRGRDHLENTIPPDAY